MPTFGSLFAGIGGIDLGLERAGWTGRWQVEWDDYCRRVLAKHWPDVARYGDVHDVHGAVVHGTVPDTARDGRTRGGPGDIRSGDPRADGLRDGKPTGSHPVGCANCLEPVDLIAGGFPCQPFSFAGKQQRLADDRWLWPEFERCIRELRPRYVLVENVPGLLVGGGMDAVLGGLADLGYDAEWESIPAAAVGAPHLRYRVWIVAHATGAYARSGAGQQQGAEPSDRQPAQLLSDASGGSRATDAGCHHGQPLADPDLTGPQGRPVQPERAGERAAGASGVGDTDGAPEDAHAEGRGSRRATSEPSWWRTEPDVGRVAHGVPARVDRLRSLGNAVVPQVVEWIGRRILEKEGLA